MGGKKKGGLAPSSTWPAIRNRYQNGLGGGKGACNGVSDPSGRALYIAVRNDLSADKLMVASVR